VRGCERQPAVPHSPNPALKITEPLFKSATASSAFLNNFDVLRVDLDGALASGLASLENAVPDWNFRIWIEQGFNHTARTLGGVDLGKWRETVKVVTTLDLAMHAIDLRETSMSANIH
jgi:hypothetical protein